MAGYSSPFSPLLKSVSRFRLLTLSGRENSAATACGTRMREGEFREKIFKHASVPEKQNITARQFNFVYSEEKIGMREDKNATV